MNGEDVLKLKLRVGKMKDWNFGKPQREGTVRRKEGRRPKNG